MRIEWVDLPKCNVFPLQCINLIDFIKLIAIEEIIKAAIWNYERSEEENERSEARRHEFNSRSVIEEQAAQLRNEMERM